MNSSPSTCAPDSVYVSAADLAARYSVTARTITGLAERGEIPAIKIGYQWRFDPAAVHSVLCSHTTVPFAPRVRRPKKTSPAPVVATSNACLSGASK